MVRFVGATAGTLNITVSFENTPKKAHFKPFPDQINFLNQLGTNLLSRTYMSKQCPNNAGNVIAPFRLHYLRDAWYNPALKLVLVY